MLETLTNDPLMLRKSDGTVRKFQGRVTSGKLTTFESTLPCAEGDTVERELPNSQIEKFEILELGFHQGLPPDIGPHYQMKIRKITDRRDQSCVSPEGRFPKGQPLAKAKNEGTNRRTLRRATPYPTDSKE